MTKILIPMADYGHDPTETAIPFSVFKNAGYEITFATENGTPPRCDSKMLVGMTGAILGAPAAAKKAYAAMEQEPPFQHPISWSDPAFDMDFYDVVFLPGGHDKGVRQVIDSEIIHRQLQKYFPKTMRNGNDRKIMGAICHGVQVLAFTPASNSPSKVPITSAGQIEPGKSFKSVIHSCKTTALPGQLESFIYQSTRLMLGDYYKSYGAGTPNVQDYVKLGLDDPETQFQAGPSWYSPTLAQPFVVEDDQYQYVSARFPPDAEAIANRIVDVVRELDINSKL